MPVEVKRDQGEVSVKADFENATENKQEIVVPSTKEDVVNGISHGGNNGNGHDKEDSDGSYVFITENDTVGDGSVEPDSAKPVDDANADNDLKKGEVVNSSELKMDARISADDVVMGVSQDSQTLEKPEREKADDGPEEDSGILKSEIEDSVEKSAEEQHPANGHLECGHEGKPDSTEEVEQLQDSEVGPRDLTENKAEENPVGKFESDSKTNVEEHQGDRIEAQEKSDLDVDVPEDLQHNGDVATPQVGSDEVRKSELVSAKVSPRDPNDGDTSLGQPTLTDPVDSTKRSDSENDRNGSESVAVLEYVPVENGHPIVEPELEKVDDAPFTSETEEVNASCGVELPVSGTTKVSVSDVSSVLPAETQPFTAVNVESHTSGNGVVENDNREMESEVIKDNNFAGKSKMQSQSQDGSVSTPPESQDGNVNTCPESQDAGEPAYVNQDGKQHIASELTEVLEAPTSEESNDVVVVKESVLEAAISDGLSCTNQQESERDVLESGHEDILSVSDSSVNLSDDTRSQNCSEDHGVDSGQKIQDDCSARSEEVTDIKEKHASIENVQGNNSEEKLTIGADVCLNSAEEKKESPTEDLSGTVSHESAETLSTNINSPLLDSKGADSELVESSAGVAGEMSADATKSEVAQSDKECTGPHIAPSAIEDGDINSEVNCGSEVNVTKTSPVDVLESISTKEVSELDKSDINKRSAISTDQQLSTASVASEIKTCEQDLEFKVVTSNDTIHTGAQDSVDSQLAENKGGNATDRTDDKVALTCEGSALDTSEGQTVTAEIERRSFYFLPRVPRYDDEKLSEQLKHAEAQVEQETQSRDALRADIQKIRAICKDYDIIYKAALAEERSARKAMHSKRKDIEALQSMISRVKNAASVDDIDSRVHNMEHTMQHSTLSLTEEKGFMREIKQLKQLREQISSSMGTKDEVKQALDEKEKTEERLKVLRKELDALRNDLSKAESITKAAKKKFNEEWGAQSKLQEQFRAADAVRQEAFAHLQDLKKQQREKNKYFFKYRDDSRAASEMALKKDRAALQSLCSDQVENFMNKWNNDEEFRKYYVRCNTRSTYRRLGTLDGRSLGPDEEPPRITYAPRTDKLKISSERAEKHETAPPVKAQQEKVVKYEGLKIENNCKAVAKSVEQKSQNTKSKKTFKPEQSVPIVMEAVSGKEEMAKSATAEEEEPPKLTKEEEELIKKEEEKRKQTEAAKLKEQHRLEEIAKAKEANERKKKREEKAKARAVLKAQKEVEEREKEREKKLRKKERRKGIYTSEETAIENPIETSEAVIETPREIETPKKQSVEESQKIKKAHKPPSQYLKQSKSKSVPLPLRNRGSKRKLRQYMWIGLVVLLVVALFLLGNANLSFSSANLWFT